MLAILSEHIRNGQPHQVTKGRSSKYEIPDQISAGISKTLLEKQSSIDILALDDEEPEPDMIAGPVDYHD